MKIIKILKTNSLPINDYSVVPNQIYYYNFLLASYYYCTSLLDSNSIQFNFTLIIVNSYTYYIVLSKYANIFNIYLKYKKEKEKHNLLKSTFQSQC